MPNNANCIYITTKANLFFLLSLIRFVQIERPTFLSSSAYQENVITTCKLNMFYCLTTHNRKAHGILRRFSTRHIQKIKQCSQILRCRSWSSSKRD